MIAYCEKCRKDTRICRCEAQRQDRVRHMMDEKIKNGISNEINNKLKNTFETMTDSSFTEDQIKILNEIYRDITIICEEAYLEGYEVAREKIRRSLGIVEL